MDPRAALVAKCHKCNKNIFEHDKFEMRYLRRGKTRSTTPSFICHDCIEEENEKRRKAAELEKRKKRTKIIIITTLIAVGVILLIIAFS